jgi:hypothetical protein
LILSQAAAYHIEFQISPFPLNNLIIGWSINLTDLIGPSLVMHKDCEK